MTLCIFSSQYRTALGIDSRERDGTVRAMAARVSQYFGVREEGLPRARDQNSSFCDETVRKVPRFSDFAPLNLTPSFEISRWTVRRESLDEAEAVKRD
jgi:hypothetical protein